MAKKQEKKQSWNEISGIMRVFGNEVGSGSHKFTKYSLCIAKKTDEGDYKNYYFDVKFGKSADKPDDTGEVWLDVEEAFFSVESYLDKKAKEVIKPVLVIMDCNIIE